MDRSKCDEMLDELTAVATRVARLKEERDELLKAMPAGVLYAARAHVYALLTVVEGKDTFEAGDLPAALDAMCRFTDFLAAARSCYEQLVGAGDSRFFVLDENVRIAAFDRDDPQLLMFEAEFRENWSDNMLGLLKEYIRDQFRLTEGKQELGVDDFVKLCETAFAVRFIIEGEQKHLASLAQEEGNRPLQPQADKEEASS